MAEVKISCSSSPEEEQVSRYHFFQDDTEVGISDTPTFTVPSVAPGIHKYEVAPEGPWGLGPKSDPVSTPPAASKLGGVTINIVINIA